MKLVVVLCIVLVVVVATEPTDINQCESFVNRVIARTESLIVKTDSHYLDLIQIECREDPDHLLCSPEAMQHRLELVTLMKTEKDPLGLCLMEFDKSLSSPSDSNSPACSLCKWLVQLIYSKLEDSEEHIIDFVGKTCDMLPSPSWSQSCHVWVDQYGKIIIDLLKSGLSPDFVCHFTGTCVSKPQNLQNPHDNNDHSTKCSVCVFVMRAIEDKLDDETTREEIEKWLSDVCETVPLAFRPSCERMLSDSIDEIIALLLRAFPPELICHVIRLCREKQCSINYWPMCETCRGLVDMVKGHGESDMEMASATTRMMCSSRGGAGSKWCLNLIAELERLLVFAKDGDFDVCSEIGLCPLF
ncbi:hypothetical protein P9112_010325 [Eukaryota sp. TZLM1-RC]